MVHERGQIDLDAVVHGTAVRVDVLAEQRDLAHALGGELHDLHQHVFEGPADLLAAGVRHDAVGAVLGAALHDRDEGARALGARRGQVVELLDFGEADVHLRPALLEPCREQLRQPVQRLRPEHHVDVGRTLDDRRAFLAGHAAADADQHALLLEVLDAAEVGEHLLLRLLAHRAGVEEDEVGLVHVLGGLVALGGVEHVGHLVRVVLVHLAAEGFDKDFFGHGNFKNSKQTPLPTGRGD